MSHPAGTDADRRCAEIVRFARTLAGTSTSATGFVVACFAEVGIALKDDLLSLHCAGESIVGSELLAADLIFRSGRHDAFREGDRRYGVSHVGISTGEGTVVHGSPQGQIVCEDTLDAFIDAEDGHYRGTRRIIAR